MMYFEGVFIIIKTNEEKIPISEELPLLLLGEQYQNTPNNQQKKQQQQQECAIYNIPFINTYHRYMNQNKAFR